MRFEKFEFNCNFGMIIRSLDVRIGCVFTVSNAIWVPFYNTCVRALCNFFRAIRSPPPQFQRCPPPMLVNRSLTKIMWVFLRVRTCELFLCFAVIVRVRAMMLTSMFSLFYVTGEFHRFLHRGRANNVDFGRICGGRERERAKKQPTLVGSLK